MTQSQVVHPLEHGPLNQPTTGHVVSERDYNIIKVIILLQFQTASAVKGKLFCRLLSEDNMHVFLT